MKNKTTKIYICDHCGNEFTNWVGRCSYCGQWNSLKEVNYGSLDKSDKGDTDFKVTSLSEIKITNKFRKSSGIGEFDRVLGGGIVPGSVILLGGEPGIGKSTLLLQLCHSIKKTLYLSGEESLAQIKIRAERLDLSSDILLVASGDIEKIEKEAIKNEIELIIIDSIQTVFLSSIASTPGSMVQVRECGIFLQQLAKKTGIPVIIIGHVTKEGTLAGPRILEHLVDIVLYLEGERFHDARVLRGVKNRFGATNEVGIFAIRESGLVEIKNPSKLFLSERQNTPGSVITSTMEGTRPLLIEVQALAVPTHFGYPKRTSSGFDLNRLNLLSAVITKSTKCNLANSDIYLNIVGGMKINEPAVDLAVCASIISSYLNKPLEKNLCLFGEVGLSGEIRRVTRQSDREKEAIKLGYSSPANPKNLSQLIKQLGL